MFTGQKKLKAEKRFVPLVKQLCNNTKISETWKKSYNLKYELIKTKQNKEAVGSAQRLLQ
jgi:hypothetical protein